MGNTRVLCYSGGMDSYCLNALNEYDEYVFFDPGTEESRKELDLVKEHLNKYDYHYIEMSGLSHYQMDNQTIPLRNIIFAFMAANYGNEIHLGGTFGDRFNVRDGDEVAANMASALLNYFNGFGYEVDTMPQDHSRYQVEFPLCHLTKGEILQKTVDETDETVESVLENSKTCHHGTVDEGCGECEDCIRRATAAGYVLDSPQELDTVLEEHFRVNPFEWYETADSPGIGRRKGEYEQFKQVYSEWYSARRLDNE